MNKITRHNQATPKPTNQPTNHPTKPLRVTAVQFMVIAKYHIVLGLLSSCIHASEVLMRLHVLCWTTANVLWHRSVYTTKYWNKQVTNPATKECTTIRSS